uniref:Uncharacterized protein n=2 Tax=Ceratitis capitata TaxID=7213 RepID=W8B9C1_CERCA
MSAFAAQEVPRYPRLDVKLVGNASFAPKNIKKEVHDKLRNNLRRQLFNHSKAFTEILLTDLQNSTTEMTPTANNILDLEAGAAETDPTHSAKKRQSENYITHHYLHRTHHNRNHRHSKRYLHAEDEKENKRKIHTEKESQRIKIHNGPNSHRANHRAHKNRQQQTQSHPIYSTKASPIQ